MARKKDETNEAEDFTGTIASGGQNYAVQGTITPIQGEDPPTEPEVPENPDLPDYTPVYADGVEGAVVLNLTDAANWDISMAGDLILDEPQALVGRGGHIAVHNADGYTFSYDPVWKPTGWTPQDGFEGHFLIAYYVVSEDYIVATFIQDGSE